MLFSRMQRFKIILIPTTLLWITVLYFAYKHKYQIKNTLSYATRPLWDVADGPKLTITHYYAEGIPVDARACELHGWPAREESERRSIQVIDAVLMSSELDLLDIRLNELETVVDRFLIVESNATFTGLPKETYYASNSERFEKFHDKIGYRFFPGYPLQQPDTAWDVESRTRYAMNRFILSHTDKYPSDTKALVIMSDIDEIPSRHTIELLKACDFGKSLHLQMRNFLYSFEWYLGPTSWRASAHIWTDNSYYRHSKSSDNILADSGWHCSYCFKTIPEFVVKMTGFSHSDRIGGQLDLIQPEKIQDKICQGKDIFGMLPEAYTYADLLSQMTLQPFHSAVHLPRYLIDNADRFRFLLPGGCLRET